VDRGGFTPGFVAVFDALGFQIVDTVDVSPNPASLATGCSLYVGDRVNGALTVIDLRTHMAGLTLRLGFDISDLAVNPVNGVLYVADSTANRVVALDPVGLQQVDEVNLAFVPDSIAIQPDGSLLLVSHPLDDAVSVVETEDLTVANTLALTQGMDGTGLLGGESAFATRSYMCPLFADGFESGDTSAWSSTQ
jgi:DNA-binding beta-propeller fold protein YncE